MASIVVLPKQGNSVESCIIVRWLKNVGDAIKEGDGLCEVETDKATVEVPATAAGTLLAQVRKQGEDVPVQTPLAVIGNAGEDVAALLGAPAVAATPAASAQQPAPSAQQPTAGAQQPAPSSQQPTATCLRPILTCRPRRH